jgi:hypothetical protein
MYEPNGYETTLMQGLKDLGYTVWWDGSKIISNADNYTKSTLEILVNRGWVKGE